jgi:hypothetical protein
MDSVSKLRPFVGFYWKFLDSPLHSQATKAETENIENHASSIADGMNAGIRRVDPTNPNIDEGEASLLGQP